MGFREEFRVCCSFDGMREASIRCLSRFSKSENDKIYRELDRGKKIIEEEKHLDGYLKSFGKMHKAKLNYAFGAFDQKLREILPQGIEIFDWGCGQGLATICLLDYLIEKGIAVNIKKITLIEPSEVATQRAEYVLNWYKYIYHYEFDIQVINKVFDDLKENDIQSNGQRRLHLFSNILDVEFDLVHFIDVFQKTCKGENYLICVGPYYSNSRRVDDFIAALSPDKIIASGNFNKGEFESTKDWTLSIKICSKKFSQNVESIGDIRKRINESYQNQQFFAGYILDCVSQTIKKLEHPEYAEDLLRSLSSFDVTCSSGSIKLPEELDPKLSVLNNILTRGLPTLAPIQIEERFAEVFKYSNKPSIDSPAIVYNSNGKLDGETVFSALHVIDPRFKLEQYNTEKLESDFEKDFIEAVANDNDTAYIVQALEPQRLLSTLVSVPDKNFAEDKRVDFSLQLPYYSAEGGNDNGFILEIDGYPYHSNIFNRIADKLRDKITGANEYKTNRIKDVSDRIFIHDWEKNSSAVLYLKHLKENYEKEISGEWKDVLEIVLSPLAIARIEKVLIEAVLTKKLDLTTDHWDILVVERDVPGAYMAIEDFKDSYSHICKLEGIDTTMPKINLTVVSTQEFKKSKLHLGNTTLDVPNNKYDICIDISMLLRDKVDALPLKVNATTSYIVRTSHYKHGDRKVYCAKNITYSPLVRKNNQGEYEEILERKEILTYFLKNIFRKREFRAGQIPILSRTLSGKTTIGLLPTGGGKSLTYQLSSMLEPGVAVVVDPLVSLMVDQVRGLNSIRIDSCSCINSNLEVKEKYRRLGEFEDGNVQIMLLSPERFMMENFRQSLVVMTKENNVYFSFGVIDEVHCVSEWGHDFRPAYLHLGRNMMTYMTNKTGTLPIIGLTATASFDVLADVERELTLGDLVQIDSDTIVRPEDDRRNELFYKVVEVKANFEKVGYRLIANDFWQIRSNVAHAKKEKVCHLLEEIPQALEYTNKINPKYAIPGLNKETFYNADEYGKYKNAGIVFCPHRKGSFGVNNLIVGNLIVSGFKSYLEHCNFLNIGSFIGGDDIVAVLKFNQDEQNIMVATKAFGMGIDKSNVRYTINVNHPSSIESFVQEAGRAGRDKKNAISYILYEPTECICLTEDKLQELYNGLNLKLEWPRNHKGEYILKDDFVDFGKSCGVAEDEVKRVKEYAESHGFFENDDKEIQMYFHNNSFRGAEKEKRMLHELRYNILSPTRNIDVIQQKLQDIIENTDVILEIDNNNNAIRVKSKGNPGKSYGCLYLTNFSYTTSILDFPSGVCNEVLGNLTELVSNNPIHTIDWLMQPITDEGIYTVLSTMQNGEYTYVVVTFENSLQADGTRRNGEINQARKQIAQQKGWNDVNVFWNGIGDFRELVQLIADISNDPRWIQNISNTGIYGPLIRAFCKKRDKNDTDKAIYRLCCIGIVDDVQIDYNYNTYRLKIVKKTDEEYIENMRHFFEKYYSRNEVDKHIEELLKHEGDNILDKCCDYLTEFTYKTLKRKRLRAIEDIRIACETSILREDKKDNGEEGWLKEYIHLYFNSKYYRSDYKIDTDDYSLTRDVQGENSREDYSIVEKYLDAVLQKDNSGTPIDNVKHLYGATLLNLRANPANGALNLLKTYCLVYLKVGENEKLRRDAYTGYIEGFMRLYEVGDKELVKHIEKFNEELRKLDEFDSFVKELIERKSEILLRIHSVWLEKFKQGYLR